jgi:hypothetical protein
MNFSKKSSGVGALILLARHVSFMNQLSAEKAGVLLPGVHRPSQRLFGPDELPVGTKIFANGLEMHKFGASHPYFAVLCPGKAGLMVHFLAARYVLPSIGSG